MQRKYLVLSKNERLELINEYKEDVAYEKRRIKALDAAGDEKKSSPLARRAFPRPFAVMIGALDYDHGYSLPGKVDRQSGITTFLVDIMRGHLINGKRWSGLEEYKEIADAKFTADEKKPFIEKFIKDSWELSETEAKNIWTDLETFHHQSLVPSVFSLAFPYAVKHDPFSPLNVNLKYTGNYTRSTDKVIHFDSVAQYTLKAADTILFDIPGTISCDYTLMGARGFLASKDTPRFSNSLLKVLSLARESTIHLSTEAIELAKAEEELRKLFADTRLERSPPSLLEPSKSELEDKFPSVTQAHSLLDNIEKNLSTLLQTNDKKTLKQLTQSLQANTAILTANLKSLEPIVNSQDRAKQYVFSLAKTALKAGVKLFAFPTKTVTQKIVAEKEKDTVELRDSKDKDEKTPAGSPFSPGKRTETKS